MSFKQGDAVVTVLSGAGVETCEQGSILYVRNGEAFVDEGAGNDPDGPFDADTGRWLGSNLVGFTRWIEKRGD